MILIFKDRKRQAELSKLEMNMKRQKAVMQRKTEKTEAELKRFKELLLRTKQNNIRRTLSSTGANKKEQELVKWKVCLCDVIYMFKLHIYLCQKII